jgi:hypothetical protein
MSNVCNAERPYDLHDTPYCTLVLHLTPVRTVKCSLITFKDEVIVLIMLFYMCVTLSGKQIESV